ncbi:DUF4055 domain-containing protein, partial [Synechococcus lacustris Tous-12m]
EPLTQTHRAKTQWTETQWAEAERHHPWQYLTATFIAGDGSLTSGSLTPGSMNLSTETLLADPQAPSGWRTQQIEQRHYQAISQLPAIWYASDGSAFGEGELPHLGLAHQYLNHFRCQSDYQELLYRTALPVGVRTGVAGPLGSSSASEPVVLGPNSVIDLPEGASFQFVEIQARSLAEHRSWLELLDQGMRRDALIPSGAQGHRARPLKYQWLHHRHTPCCRARRFRKHRCFHHYCSTGAPLQEKHCLITMGLH